MAPGAWFAVIHRAVARALRCPQVACYRGCLPKGDKTLLRHKAAIFQVERSLVISDVVLDKKMLTQEKTYCQMNDKFMLFNCMLSTTP